MLIKNLQNNRSVVFDRGNFDTWCVYVVEANGDRYAHLDATYFTYFKDISTLYPEGKVYEDFLSIYNLTTANLDANVITLIDDIVGTYNEEHRIDVEKWFTVIYGGMIAESKKANTRLGRRIKRLGVFQVLIQGMLPTNAANFSKGRGWRELDAIMTNNGF